MSSSATIGDEVHHVAVCTFPFGTHPASLLQLVRRINASTPQDFPMSFTFLSSAASNKALFGGGAPAENIRPHTMAVPEGDEEKSKGNEIDRFMEGGEEALKRAIAEAEAETGIEIDCVLSDAFLWFSRAIAEENSASWIPLWTTAPPSLSAHVSTDLFRTKFGLEGIQSKEQESADLIPGFSGVLAKDLPRGVVTGDLASPLCQMLHNAGLNAPKATAVCINSFQELDPKINQDLKSKLPDLFNVGPFPLTSPPSQDNVSDEHGCMAWLDQHKGKHSSVVYIAFGTVTTPPKDDIMAIAEALEAKGSPFLWSMNKSSQDLLPDGFLERFNANEKGKVVSWAPQPQVLGHPSVGAFVSHCGWNSVLESIVSGVPIVCMPFSDDQMLNSRFIDTIWKVGVRMEGEKYNKDGIKKALETVLSEEEGKSVRETIRAMKEKAEEAAKSPDGSSIKDIERLVDLIISSSKKEKREKEAHGGAFIARPWRKWFKVFRVWRR